MYLKFSLYLNMFLFIFISSIGMFYLFLFFLINNIIYFIEWEIVNFKSCSIVMIFLLDWMSLLFMSFVMFISSLVIIYSKSYMDHDKNKNRFIILVMLFVFSMMMLIISPNLISILLGWDGLGLISYCLVIYFQNIKSFNAGMLTVLSNRVGDVALLMGIAWMLNFGGWSFYFYLDFMLNDWVMMWIGLLVLLASITKSAQIPFSAWLPAAMAAPTPVSALVHSSTLVTAGVYLLIRFHYLMNSFFLFFILMLLGSLTMFMSGLGANFEMDLKKIIALSTLSQLGLMMSSLSIGFYKLTFFHLLTHALFKALLFLCAGVLIHNSDNFQDIRLLGGSMKYMSFTLMCFNVANLALCGIPFLAGFYSKDLILDMILMSNMNFMIFFFFFSTGLTVSYSFRLVYMSSCMSFNGFSLLNLNDSSYLMYLVMFLLSLFSVFGGSMIMWLIFPDNYLVILPIYLKVFVLFICLLGSVFGYFISSKYSVFIKNFNLFIFNSIWFFSWMWFLPTISSFNFNYYFLKLGGLYYNDVDLGWNELFSGNFLFFNIKQYSLFFQVFQNNYLVNYLIMTLSFIIFCGVYMFY